MSEVSRDTIIAAAEQAIAAAEPAPANDVAPDVAPANDVEPAPEPVAAEPETKLAQVIRAKKEAQKIRGEAQQEKAALARERAEIDALKARIKDAPLLALKELGLDVAAVNQHVLNEGTPEAEIAKIRKELEAERAARETWQQSVSTREARAAEEAFVAIASKQPTLAALYADEPQELLSRAYAVQKAYHEKTGEVPTREEIAEYLETVEARRYAKLTKTAPAPAKTISPKAAAATSAPTKAFKDMTPGEQKRHLIRVAQDAERNYKPTEY